MARFLYTLYLCLFFCVRQTLHFIDLIIFRTFITNRVREKSLKLSLEFVHPPATPGKGHIPTRAQLVSDTLPPSLWDVPFGFFKCPLQAALLSEAKGYQRGGSCLSLCCTSSTLMSFFMSTSCSELLAQRQAAFLETQTRKSRDVL